MGCTKTYLNKVMENSKRSRICCDTPHLAGRSFYNGGGAIPPYIKIEDTKKKGDAGISIQLHRNIISIDLVK